MDAMNTIVIMSDEHTRSAMGCYGHSHASTPNLDELARRGTMFTRAYCNSPLCVPSRGSMVTGRYVHEVGCWDNAHPWEGKIPGWPHRLRENGHLVASIGKLHFRSRSDDNGFSEELLPMHVQQGIGDLTGLLRKQAVTYPAPAREGQPEKVNGGPAVIAQTAGPGESNHTHYDREITQTACDWLRKRSVSNYEKPWVLFVSFVSPHFPLTAPKRFYDLYDLDRLEMPVAYDRRARPRHPVIDALRRIWNFDDYFPDEMTVRRAIAGYLGLCSFVDDNVGQILKQISALGLEGDTRIIYTSDHGESLGARGLWSPSSLYEESIGIPLIMKGPDVTRGKIVDKIVSLVDLYPTLLDGAGIPMTSAERLLPGQSLFKTAMGNDPARVVLSEYHGGGSISGSFSIHLGQWKYCYYVGHPPQLFDLQNDSNELIDLAGQPKFRTTLESCERSLRTIVDPEAIDARAFRDQARTIEKHGGTDGIRSAPHRYEHALDRKLGYD